MNGTNLEIDEIDALIVRMLMIDARTSIKEIAESSGLSSNAIINRIEGMRSKGIITGSTILFNPKFLDERYAASIEIDVEQGEKNEVLHLIRSHPSVLMCFDGIGRCDILVFIGAKCVGELDYVKEAIIKMPGVKRVNLTVRVDEFKFLFHNLDIGTRRV